MDIRSASDKFEAEAAHWERTGEIQASTDLAVGTLRLWMASQGAKTDGVTQLLGRYRTAAEKQIAKKLGTNWYDMLLRLRASCICGTGYRLENLGFCTHCDALIGPCCQFRGGTAPNGNLKCPRCGTGETVG